MEQQTAVEGKPTCHCAWCDWVRMNGKNVVEPTPGHTYKVVPRKARS